MKQTRGSEGPGGSDERGQSEVIGTILVVAIVIILSAGVGQFVFGLDIVTFDQPTVGPQASFGTTQHDDGSLTIDHNGGDTLDNDTISIVGSESGTVPYHVGPEWTSGESVTIDESDLTAGETIRIVWESPETDDSNTVFVHEYEG